MSLQNHLPTSLVVSLAVLQFVTPHGCGTCVYSRNITTAVFFLLCCCLERCCHYHYDSRLVQYVCKGHLYVELLTVMCVLQQDLTQKPALFQSQIERSTCYLHQDTLVMALQMAMSTSDYIPMIR